MSIGNYVFSDGQAGAATENGSSGSQVGLAISVPASAEHVSIESIAATVIASSVTGDDAFLGFASAGQSLPGGAELPYGGSDYVANESWSLPQGARDFEAYVNCSTDRSSPTCNFADAVSVPALSNVALTLSENVPPALSATSGTLFASASSGASVNCAQSVGFGVSDADSGVLSATLRLSPKGGGTPYSHEFSFAPSCEYASWNACPLSQTVGGFVLDTATLRDDSYLVELTLNDAAGNTATYPLGTVLAHNAPTNSAPPTIPASGALAPGTTLSAFPGAWSSPSAAGEVSYGYQWERCDREGTNCKAIAGATQAGYTAGAPDAGLTLRVSVSAANDDGATLASSATTSLIEGEDSTSAQAGVGATLSAGAPNGTGASELARVKLDVNGSLSRSFARRAFTLSGQVSTRDGHPIVAANLDVLQQVVGGARAQVIARVRSSAEGAFAVRIPAGPSRTIKVGYRAFSGDASYSAEASLSESVAASVSLSIDRLRKPGPVTIVLHGNVQGPIPRGGAKVELLVHYRGQWVPFRTPFTDARGRYRAVYQFGGSIGSFPFRAIVPRGQAGLPFSEGKSRTLAFVTGGG
jgi:hypothetical protein